LLIWRFTCVVLVLVIWVEINMLAKRKHATNEIDVLHFS